MTARPLPIRRLLLAASSAALVLSACVAEEEAEPALIEKNGIVFGEVWDGPERKLYSQANEELIIRDFFQDRKGGIFVDVGSADPIESSTTYYLEKHLGWSGIAIDAQARYARRYAKERPGTRFFSYIVTDHAAAREKFYVVIGGPDLSTTSEGVEFAGQKLETKTVEVPAITLDALLDREGATRIDFLSLDIEGAEPQALAGLDIQRYRPELVCVEVSLNGDVLEQYFAKKGYERIERYRKYDRVNWYFTPIAGEGGKGSG